MSAYHGGDPANYPQASIGFDYDEVEERMAARSRQVPIVDIPVSIANTLYKFIAHLIDSTDYKLRLDVAIAAIGIPIYQGSSYTELAVKHTITKQAFDKHVLKFQKDFQLPVTRSQKSPHARLSYRKTQLERQERLKTKEQQQEERTKLIWQNSLKKALKEPWGH